MVMTTLILFSSTNLLAKEKDSKTKLINLAGKQRMLSQRIAKDYLYLHKNIAMSKTKKELQVSLNNFFDAHSILVHSIKNEEIKNLLAFVELSTNDFNETIHEPFTLDNAQLILDLSESMLEGSQYIVDSIKNTMKQEESKIIEIAGKQRMLAQRIAKYYIAYQSGIKDENTVRSMKQTVIEFNKNLNILLKHKNNTPIIQKKINEVNKLWKIVHKFYNNIEKGGLPLIVFNTTDKITKKMNEITQLYFSLQK
jgi:nitrate/nitrite-specific signal transduction histidine kinase